MHESETDENRCSGKKKGECLLRRKFTIDKATRGIVLGYVQKYGLLSETKDMPALSLKVVFDYGDSEVKKIGNEDHQTEV